MFLAASLSPCVICLVSSTQSLTIFSCLLPSYEEYVSPGTADNYDDHHNRQFTIFGFQYEFKSNIDHAGGTVHDMIFNMVVLNLSVMIVIADV